MYIVVQGLVHVVRGEPKPGAHPVAVLSEGSFFGEMALVSRAPRLASVVAARDGLLFAVSQTAYDQLAAAHPSIRKVVEEFYRERLLANLLAVSPLFRAFGQDQKRQVAARFKLHQFASGEEILVQGKPGAGLFVVLRGECEVFHTEESGEQLPYPPLREGDVFGEISLLFGSLCTATVRAGTRCDVLELPKADFDQLVLPHPSVKSIVDRVARERLARTADLLLVNDTPPISWLV
jgi:cAMP-dependent protein kinase regulator